MKILVTNDDGIYAKGLWMLVDALRGLGDVLVVAPDREQSAVGTSVTLHHPLRVKKANPLITGVESYFVEGTPADSVILGLRLFGGDGVDLVVSGINAGLNLGNDVFISGTVGAALQGYFDGIPALAISSELVDNRARFDVAAKLAGLLVKKFQQNELPPKILLNTNVVNQSIEQIEGIEPTSLGHRTYKDKVEKGHDGRRDYYWIVRGTPEWEGIKGTDIKAIRQNKISITALQGNLNASDTLLSMPNLCSSLFKELQDSLSTDETNGLSKSRSA